MFIDKDVLYEFHLLNPKKEHKGNFNPKAKLSMLLDLPYFYNTEYAKCSEKTGYIKYEIRNGVAKTADYKPKATTVILKSKHYEIRQFGFYLEYLCTLDLLASENVKFITTSSSPSKSRQKQLAKVGLPFDTKKDIYIWLEGLLCGIEIGKNNYDAGKYVQTVDRLISRVDCDGVGVSLSYI
jgi:hypothetical protein